MLEYHSIYLPRYLEILNGLGMLKVRTLHLEQLQDFWQGGVHYVREEWPSF
jgi:hypothetical protein